MVHAFNSSLLALWRFAHAQPRIAIGGGGLALVTCVQLIAGMLAGQLP